jgi:hypothetical protein
MVFLTLSCKCSHAVQRICVVGDFLIVIIDAVTHS